MPFPVSAGVNVSEIDLTAGIPAVSVSTGAFAGKFNWGPVNDVVQVTSEAQLVDKFSKPDNNTAIGFFTAANFLAYSNDLRVVRAEGANMKNSFGNSATPFEIANADVYFSNYYSTVTANTTFAARFPGKLGDSLEVVVFANGTSWTANSTNTSDPLYTFANHFSWAPGTTPYTTQVSGGAVTGDEIHILVVDQDGLFTGQANTVLEVYQGLSKLSDAKDQVGGSNYYREVLWKKSKFVYDMGHPSANVIGWGTTVGSLPTFVNDANANVSIFTGGNSGIVVSGNVTSALALLADPVKVDISLLMTGDADVTVQNYAIGSVGEVRKDLVVFASPSLASAQDTTDPAAAIVTYVNTMTRSSYAVVDSGWKYQYDKYNDVYRWIPLNGDVAGLCARTDDTKDPWWSPAGLQRGQIKNSVKLAFNPGQAQRDTLYKAGVNPVVSFPGEGTLLFGDKTFLNFTSAFDRINVRRLFIVLEKAISKAARASLFEFNDNFTRAQFSSLVTPFLRTVQGRRGVTDFKVVCDTTNNTPDVINANQFVGDIYIVPNRSINYIQLNFVAVRTGVSFNTIVGQF